MPAAALGATVWTWVDENGVRHYTDRPVEGAERIELGEVQGFPAPRRPSVESSGEQPEDTAPPYERLTIVQPEQTETLWNIEGTLEVTVALEPSLMAGHVVDLYLDGERQYLDRRQLSFTVEGVYRGVHSLQAVVLNARGEELMRSAPRDFVVQQTSLLNPNNPRTSPPGAN